MLVEHSPVAVLWSPKKSMEVVRNSVTVVGPASPGWVSTIWSPSPD